MDTILKNRKLIRSIKKAGKKTKNVFNLYDREGDKINKKPLYIPSGKLFNIVFELGYSFIQNEETQEYEKISIESSNKKKYIKFLKTLFPKLF